MDQVKFAEDSLPKANFTWSIPEYFVPNILNSIIARKL